MNTIFSFFLDCLFPLRCRICSAPQNPETNPGGFVCKDCFSSIAMHQWVFCPVCDKKCIGFEQCQSHKVPMRFLGVAGSYQNQALKRLLWDYKYKFIEPLAAWLAGLLVKHYEAAFKSYVEQNKQEWIVTAIPLASSRLRWRGFNQAELLAKEFSRTTGIPYVPILERTSFKSSQMQLGTHELRKENVKNAFRVKSDAGVSGKRVILIDDIATSGATLLEAARTLKQNKAKEILGLVVARNDPV